MTISNMISMFFKNATTSDWVLTIFISLIAAYQNMDWGGECYLNIKLLIEYPAIKIIILTVNVNTVEGYIKLIWKSLRKMKEPK